MFISETDFSFFFFLNNYCLNLEIETKQKIDSHHLTEILSKFSENI